MKRYPGSYTLSSLLAEDADLLLGHIAILDEDVGVADGDDSEEDADG